MNNITLGLFIVIFSYYIGIKAKEKLNLRYMNPMLISIIITVFILKVFKISYVSYSEGANIVSYLMLPATVALVVPFYKNLHVFLKYRYVIVASSLLGTIVALVSILIMSKLLGLGSVPSVSILPKSITTAIALALVKNYAGILAVTALSIAGTGIFGAIVADGLFSILKIDNDIAKGSALGTASHAIGTSKAVEISEVSGSIAGLSLILTGLFTVLLFPFFVRFF